MKKQSLLRTSVYADEYTTELSNFLETRLFKRLSSKYEIKPYYKSNRTNYIVSTGGAYVFNLFSAFVGSYFAYSLLSGVVPYWVNIFFTTLLLFMVEYAKRSAFELLVKTFLQFRKLAKGAFLLCFILILFSAFASYKGSNSFIQANTAPVQLINTDSINKSLGEQINKLKVQQAELKKIKYKGNTTRTAQRAIDKIQTEILEVRSFANMEMKEARRLNIEALSLHRNSTSSNALLFSLLALIIDAGIIFCIAYCEYYDYRSLAEFSTTPQNITDNKTDSKEEATSTAPVHTANCAHCGGTYEMTRKNKKYCSTDCRQSAYEERTGKQLRVKGL